MAATTKIVLISVISFWLISSFQLAGCSRPGFGVRGDTSISTHAQDFEKGTNSGGAAFVGARPVASGPNPIQHNFAIRTASHPPAPESEP
ncbi:hypothetical protein CUMW_122380 [Citrus unshiu]|uniref:Uncharacterized protein n=3 Tax=Citrus TaxID=2706 RepID=A0A067FC36_CITSI|nr:hypothetical protein CISIN_1g034628mg [Citrus sinensis]GAY49872.1 hypothetical protein CUMW_122380 [Citrus unshiu]